MRLNTISQFTLSCTAITLLSLPSLTEANSFQGRFETKIHYRVSDDNRFAVNFPFPPEALPVGETSAFLETVDAGDRLELSTLNFAGRWAFTDEMSFQFRLDLIDLYDRNPTSTDVKYDLDHIFFQWGENTAPLATLDSNASYVRIGKFAKFERQRARRTESYGLASTAFNRFEDSGIEMGFDSPQGIYVKASLTTGNPLFIRDPNALAGDNGTLEIVEGENPDPELKSGIVILYDAEVEDFDLRSYSEYGVGLGYRWNSADQSMKLNALVFNYQRNLQEQRSLHGTTYGTDLDLLDLGEVAPGLDIRLPVSGDEKKESGLNLWLMSGNFSLFSQYVTQEIASLDRSAFELETSYVFDHKMPITPVIRYSNLSNDFSGSPLYPAPSVWWDWEKIDLGVNVDLTENLRITLEYSINRFERGNKTEDNNEGILTLRWQNDSP